MSKYRFIYTALFHKLRSAHAAPGLLYFYLAYYLLGGLTRLARTHIGQREYLPLVSYPCSGRSWLDTLMVYALAVDCHSKVSSWNTSSKITASLPGAPIIDLSHAGSSWEAHPYTQTDGAKFDPRRWTRGRAIFLWRDPRDVQVSAFHHIRGRSGAHWVTPRHMVDDPIIGIGKQIAFLNAWAEYIERHPDRIAVLRYESLKANPKGELQKVLNFAGVPVSDAALDYAVRETSIERMQEKELRGEALNPRMASVGVKDKSALKTRSGRVGGYREFFEPDQADALDRAIEEDLHPHFRKALS